jgi:sulfate/thiosulfate transport system permease protein
VAVAEAALPTRRPGGRARLRPGAATGRWPLPGAALLYLGLFILLPVAAILQRGFGTGLDNLSSALSSIGAWSAIKLTLILAVLTAIINGCFGTLLAYVLARIRFPGRSLLSTVVDLPFAVPTLVAGVMLAALYGPGSVVGGWLERHGIHVVDAPPGILLALLFVTLPLVVRSVQPVLLELDPAEEEAARVLGAGRWTTFRKVVFPALRPAITAGSLQALARALGEFGAVVIVSGNITNKTLTAPVFISQLLLQPSYGAAGGPDQAAAVSALLFGLAFVIVFATEKISSRGSGWLKS